MYFPRDKYTLTSSSTHLEFEGSNGYKFSLPINSVILFKNVEENVVEFLDKNIDGNEPDIQELRNKNLFLKLSPDETNPPTADLDTLFNDLNIAIMSASGGGGGGGDASEATLLVISSKLDSLVADTGSNTIPPIIDEADANTTYIGYAPLGSLQNASVWRIKKVTVSGNITTTTYPSGSTAFSFRWDLRATYTYSR